MILPRNTPSAAGAPLDIEPARVQFIEQTFRDVFGSRAAGGREEIVRWVHRRLFLEGASLETVRVELNSRERRTRLVAVTSGKGGVGKTTFSVNLAVAFAQRGQRVLLFDADLGMANVHIFAGVNPTATLLDVIDRRAGMEEVLAPGPAGIQVICGASGISRLADLSPVVLEALGRELLRIAADFDVLVMDTGAGVSASVMRFLGLAQDAIIVATPNLAAILDSYGVIKLIHENRLGARMHLLINQAADEGQAARVQERIAGCASRFLQHAPGDLGCLFHDSVVEQCNQSRHPLVLAHPEHVNAQRIAAIAAGFSTDPAGARPARASRSMRTAAA
jgi:flagellar biosynthesis protein FlhG